MNGLFEGRTSSHLYVIYWYFPLRYQYALKQCPHDGVCPLYQPGSSRLVCGFSQRIQRPSFVRKTKHSGVGHEDVEYSYVVIRRGPRPSASIKNLGRIGEVGKRALEKEALSNIPAKELQLHSEYQDKIGSPPGKISIGPVTTEIESEPWSAAEVQEALRREAFNWPRLVFPPLKKSGHVILDSCTAEGNVL